MQKRTLWAWLVVAPWALWAVFRTAEVEGGLRAVQVIAFTPYVAAASLLPLVVALCLRAWTALVIGAVSTALLVAAVLPRATGGQEVATRDGITIMTINLDDGGADPQSVVAAVRQHEVEVVVLQELNAFARADLRTSGLNELLPHWFLPRGDSSVMAVGSLRPIRPISTPDPIASETFAAVQVMAGAGDRLEIWNVHPPSPTGEQKLADWREAFANMPAPETGGVPRILAGDFNATLDHLELRDLLDQGFADAAADTGAGLQPTFSTGGILPAITIDHVLFAETMLEAGHVSTITVPGTDHRALVARLSPTGRR